MARIQELTWARGNRALLLLALLAGLVTAVLVFVALAQNDDDGGGAVSTAGAPTKVVVATQDIAAGAEIKEGMLKVIEVPQALLVKNALADTVPVVGQTARFPIIQGEQLTGSKIGAQTKEDGLAYVVPKGKRAVGIKVEEVTAVGGLLLPGNHVDVIASFDKDGVSNSSSINNSRVVTVLQDIEVLAVAQEAQEPVPATEADKDNAGTQLQTSGRLPEDVGTQPRAGTVTVAVDPLQAQILVGVQQEAKKVWLSLRPFGETGPTEIPKVDIASIVGP